MLRCCEYWDAVCVVKSKGREEAEVEKRRGRGGEIEGLEALWMFLHSWQNQTHTARAVQEGKASVLSDFVLSKRFP